MTNLKLRHDARILVCDGKTALFLKNNGTPGHEMFEVESAIRQELPAHNADIGADKPGRVGQAFSGPRSSIETPDWHSEQERAFVSKTVDDFTAHCKPWPKAQIVIVAPPRALAVIREKADRDLMARCVAEIDKELTRHPVAEIQKIVLG